MVLNARERAVYFALLKQYTSLGVVSLFLKKLGLPHSGGSWDEMIEKRLEPAIVDDKITRTALLQLLADAEEFGHQNIFLFRCPRNVASELINEDTVTRELKRLGREDLLQSPPIVDGAHEPALAQVRFEHEDKKRGLVVKSVEIRSYWEKVEETRRGSRIIKEYEERSQRAVNVARLSEDGLLEIRIQSYERAADYEAALSDFWSRINPLLPQRKFSPQSIHKFKEYLIKNRATLEGEIRYAPLLARSGTGFTMALGVPDLQQSLFKDKGATEGFAAFAKYDATVETGNFIWIKRADGNPSKDIHIRIAGRVNQFAVVVSCERADHEHVFRSIRQNNA